MVMLLDSLRGLVAPLFALWLKLLVDGAVAQDLRLALAGAAGMAISVPAAWFFGGTATRIQLTLEDRVGFYLDSRLMELSSGVPGIEHHERPEYLDRLELVRQQRGALGNAARALITVVGALVQIAVVATLLWSVHPLLLLFPALGPPVLLAEGAWQRRVGKAEEEAAREERLADHLERLAIEPGPAKEVRVFGLEGELLRRHAEALERARRVKDRAQWRGGLPVLGAWALFAAGFAAAVAFVALRAAGGLATPGDVLLAVSLAGLASDSVNVTIRRVSRALRPLRAARRLLWLADYAEAARPEEPSLPAPRALRRGITLEGVSFRYPGTEDRVLEDVNLDLAAGSVVALVGDNGAGKTTLVKLLCRFYEPTEGRITVDGADLSRMDPEEWRSRTSAAFQDFYRFEMTLREAVGVGDLRVADDDGAVSRALGRAGAADLPGSLPGGLGAQLGQAWACGVDLSVGQWQKVALARGLMREEPLLLILDEPTASLDAATEYALYERMALASRAGRERGMITLLISHRFSTVRMADRIVVLSGGTVVEEGSHDGLISRGGLYAELYRLQARPYE
jgi:ATP-binding cassette subfamily B protein